MIPGINEKVMAFKLGLVCDSAENYIGLDYFFQCGLFIKYLAESPVLVRQIIFVFCKGFFSAFVL